jgi:hypothetical protein
MYDRRSELERETNLYGLSPDVDLDFGKPIKTKLDAHTLSVFAHQVTLILRPLSDMTGQEKKEYAGLFSGMESINILPEIRAGRLINYFMNKKDPHQVVWLLSLGFDLFGLIDAGLAIDKTKIKN